MTRNRFTKLALAILILSGVTIFGIKTYAVEPSNSQALEIAPPLVSLKADPGQTLNTTIQLRNVAKVPVVVTNDINDFTANDITSGAPKILLDEAKNSPYSIIDWVAPIGQLDIKSREIIKVPVTINVPSTASPGGYFGVIRFTAHAPAVEGNGVGLSASLGALVFIRVNGHAKESMSVSNFYAGDKDGRASSFFRHKPLYFYETLKNSGNLYEQPTGVVTIRDMFGHVLATLPVNSAQNYVLPSTERRFNQILDNTVVGNKILFGHYTAEAKLKYGSDNQVISKNLSFWVIPWRWIVGIILALIILFFGLRFMIRRYNRHIINKAQGKTKAKRKAQRKKK